MTLAALALGQTARVTRVTTELPLLRRRMLDLGLTRGAQVRAELSNMGGSARAYRIRGALVAIRREHADAIEIEDGGR